MQRSLKIAIALAALVIVALLVRRATTAWHGAELVPGPEPFTYAAVDRSPSEIGPDLRSAGGALAIPRDRHGRACEGDPEALASVTERVTGVLAGGEPRDRVRDEMVALAQQCFDPAVDTGFCDWAAGEIDQRGDLRDLGWSVLAACPSGHAGPYFDRADAPAGDVLAFVASRSAGVAALEPPPRLPAQYSRAAIESASLEPSPAAAVRAIRQPVRYDDAAATEVLLAAYQSAPDRPRRLAIGRALGALSDPRARQARQLSCIDELGPSAELCAAADAGESMLRILGSYSYVSHHPSQRGLVLQDLEACARGEDDEMSFASLCLRDIAELDWVRARLVASEVGVFSSPGILGADADPAAAAFGATLARFPSSDSMVLALRSRGLLGEPRPMSRPPVTLAQTMVAYGRGWSLEEGSPLGAGHDRLARHLARLARPALDDVVFDEVQPEAGEPFGLGREIELVAYARSERLAVLASTDGDYYDLFAVVGLLNVLLRERGSALRFVVVDDPFVEELVVLGSAPALISAIADQLFVGVDADALE